MSETSTESTIRADCPECRGPRNAAVIGYHKDEDSDGLVDSYAIDRLLKCKGCGFVYYGHEIWCSEWVDYSRDEYGEPKVDHNAKHTYFPKPPVRDLPNWMNVVTNQDEDNVLNVLVEESYAALNGGQNILAAIGCRTIIDRAMELLEIDPALSFQEKLKAVPGLVALAPHDMDALEVLIDAGSAAAHRGWRPSDRDLIALFDVLEKFLKVGFIKDGRVKRLRESIPKRPKRRSKL